jgi:8-oxo-dGTP diphosphatase
MRSVGTLQAGTDARRAELVPVHQLLGRRPKRRLAFDHRTILNDGIEHARAQLESSSLATAFVGPEFTMSDLRGVYEAAWGTELDPGNFRRKVLQTQGFVEPTGRRAASGPEGGKPPETYRAGSIDRLDPPLRRSRPPHR